MNSENLQQHTTIQSSVTAQSVLSRIELESITPTARIRFTLSEWWIWLTWAGTVVFGSAALAIFGYVALSANYALYEATHTNFFTFVIAVMPYVWIILFACMTYVAVYELKKTKRGYRYSTQFILGSSVLCTVLGAMLLHGFGVGYLLDQKLGQQLSIYMSMEKMEQKMWQMPEDGRLTGRLLISTVTKGESASSVLNFKDNEGVVWRLGASELRPRDVALLQTGAQVRLLGTTTSAFTFHICGVFPWQQGRVMGRKEMIQERRDFDQVMVEHKGMAQRVEGGGATKLPEIVPVDRLCSHLEVMKRMYE